MDSGNASNREAMRCASRLSGMESFLDPSRLWLKRTRKSAWWPSNICDGSGGVAQSAKDPHTSWRSMVS